MPVSGGATNREGVRIPRLSVGDGEGRTLLRVDRRLGRDYPIVPGVEEPLIVWIKTFALSVMRDFDNRRR
jgi:hypothetical protein